MSWMFQHRPNVPSSTLRPETAFLRILQAPDQLSRDEVTGLFSYSSQAFGPSTDDRALSGNLEQLLDEDGVDPKTLPTALKRVVGAAKLGIGGIQQLRLTVHHEKVPDNWYHGSVKDYPNGGSARQKRQREMKRIAEIYIPIDQTLAQEWYAAKQAEKAREAAASESSQSST